MSKLKLEVLSNTIVGTIRNLKKNRGLCRLLIHEDSNPFKPITNSNAFDNIANVNSEYARILPYPFDPEATSEEKVFIRVYYNHGDFSDNEVIMQPQLHIDIICAKELWLINGDNGNGDKPLVRPYEIMGYIVDLLGRGGIANPRLQFNGFQHLSVNNKFDCIRLYAEHFSIETKGKRNSFEA